MAQMVIYGIRYKLDMIIAPFRQQLHLQFLDLRVGFISLV